MDNNEKKELTIEEIIINVVAIIILIMIVPSVFFWIKVEETANERMIEIADVDQLEINQKIIDLRLEKDCLEIGGEFFEKKSINGEYVGTNVCYKNGNKCIYSNDKYYCEVK
jgi:hypothetical protein